jgi:type VI secretion system protein VasD
MRALLAACLAACLTACATSPAPQRTVRITVLASPALNPDGDGRPSPVMVRLYELADTDGFQQAGFFDLSDHDKEVLGANALARMVVAVRPGERLTLCHALEPRSRHLAVMVAYRDIYRARWRGVVALPLSADSAWTVALGPDSVSIQPGSRSDAATGTSAATRNVQPDWRKLSGAIGSMAGSAPAIQPPAMPKGQAHVLEQ